MGIIPIPRSPNLLFQLEKNYSYSSYFSTTKTKLSPIVYFCRKCSQFWGCCPSFYGKYQVSIQHFAPRWNYLLGNLVRLEFPRWGRNSCSLLSAKFELWRPPLSKVKSRKSRLRCNPKLLTKGLPLKSWQQLLHFFQHQYTSSCTFTYFY